MHMSKAKRWKLLRREVNPQNNKTRVSALSYVFSYLALLAWSIVFPGCLSAGGDIAPFSMYTDLSGTACSLLKEDQETGSSVHKCPGVGGYELLVADDDARMSVTVVTPESQEYPLNYWDVITHSFSSLGKKAEWRVISESGTIQPIALIVRVVASDQSDLLAPKQKPYLAVAKITPKQICVTAKIDPVKHANEQARRVADQALNQACLMP